MCSELITNNILWNYDGSGFYHASLSFYDLGSRSNRIINSLGSVWGLKGPDTLLQANTYLDTSGNIIGNIANPRLENIIENQIIVKAAQGKDWNNELGLVVYKELNQGSWKLSITNLDGSYYRVLPEITPMDSNPVWGPENRYIIYEQNGNILVYDLETDETRYLVTSEIIEGATAFMCPEF